VFVGIGRTARDVERVVAVDAAVDVGD